MLVVTRAGALTTVQDGGRPGHAHLGVPRSGALDRRAATLANRAVGNDDRAAVLETTLTGVALRAEVRTVVAVAGAHCGVSVDGSPAPWGAPVILEAGQILAVGTATRGVRAYVAVSGGVDVPLTLGSRSTDLLSGLGPAPLRTGDELATGPAPSSDGETWPGPLLAAAIADELVLPVTVGPRDEWFTADALNTLWTATYTVSASSNRVGLRLDGAALERQVHGELSSEGMVLGAVQVPPDGKPVVFLADHPVTGGYPVIGVVTAEGVGAAAQAAPGTPTRFVIA